MTTLILNGYIVKEKADDGRMFYYSSFPNHDDSTGDFFCGNDRDQCFDIDLPIKNLLSTDMPTKCKITIELEK